MGRESSPGAKRILWPTIPGSQGQASGTPMHLCLNKLAYAFDFLEKRGGGGGGGANSECIHIIKT